MHSYFSIHRPAISTIILILSVILLVVGIERVVVGIAMPSSYGRLRFANIGISLLIWLSLCAYAIPSIYVSGFSCSCCNSLTRKWYIKNNTRHIEESFRFILTFRIGVGVMSTAVSILVIAHPISLGSLLFAIMISIAFIISGIEMMTLGISGRERFMIRRGDGGT
jgi:uncharacterized membrane protein HdeD (DUF308 family)